LLPRSGILRRYASSWRCSSVSWSACMMMLFCMFVVSPVGGSQSFQPKFFNAKIAPVGEFQLRRCS
jgi:hypothetical protein